MMAAVKRDGRVMLEGHAVGRLRAFRFHLDPGIEGADARQALTAVRRALAQEMPRRVARIEAEEEAAFQLDSEARVLWRGQPLARLIAGVLAVEPGIEVFASEFLDAPQRERIRLRLMSWLQAFLRRRLAPLFALQEAPLTALPRGIAFQLVESLGCMPRRSAEGLLRLTKSESRALAEAGVRLGSQSLFLPALATQKARRVLLQLWEVKRGLKAPPQPVDALEMAAPDPAADASFYAASGYRLLGQQRRALVLRADLLEQIAGKAAAFARQSGGFQPTPALLRLVEGNAGHLALILTAIGYRQENQGGIVSFQRRGGQPGRKGRKKVGRAGEKQRRPSDDSPFAELADLKLALRQAR